MVYKDALGLLSVLVVVGATVPYAWYMVQGRLKPHVFSWVIWTLTTGIAAAAQTAEHAGAGAWGQWASAGGCGLAVIMALRYGEKRIVRSDWIAFTIALCAIPVWLLTQNALLAVLIVTAIDLVGYYPTFRKSYVRPHQEAVFNYIASNSIYLLSLSAITDYSLTNILFQAAALLANTSLVVMILWRRRVLARLR